MPKTAVRVLSIHDALQSVLAFDLKDILRVLRPHLEEWIWCITWLDCQGDDSDSVCQAVEASRPCGIWMSSNELLAFSQKIQQTIEGTILAFPKNIDKRNVGENDLDPGEFPANRAQLAIVAVDGSWFDIYTKDPEIPDLMHQSFHDVRDEDPVHFFGNGER